MKNNTNYLEWNKKFSKTIFLIFKFIFKNYRSYAFLFLLNPAISVLILWIYKVFLNYELTPPIIMGILIGPIILCSFYVSYVFYELKKIGIIERIRLYGLKKYSISFSFQINSFIFSMIYFLVTLFYYFLFSKFFPGKFNFLILDNLLWWIWLFQLFFIFLHCILSTSIFLFISCWLNNKNTFFFSILITLLFIFIFSDFVILPQDSCSINGLNYFEYLVPTRYTMWNIYLYDSYQFLDPYGATQVVGYNCKPAIENISISISISILFILVFQFLKFYKWNYSVKE